MKENKQNIFSELTNSIKSKLYDFHYSPFMSSFIISWIIINHKYLLILFSKEKLELKLEMLNKYQFEIIYGYTTYFIIPIVIALFYVFLYPLIAFIFYKVTLIYQEMMRSEKHKIENKTLITLEEKEILINELSELKNDSNKILEKYVISEKEYQQNIRQRDEQINQLKKQLEEKKILIGEKWRMNDNLFNRINWNFHIESKYAFDKYVEQILKNKNSLSIFALYCPDSFNFLKQVDAFIDRLKISLTNNYNISSTNVYVDYIIEDKFAYPIYIHHKNKNFIIIKTAFIFKLWDILNILFGDNNYLNSIGKNTNKGVYNKKSIRESILNSFDHCILGTVYNINYSRALTECNIRDSIKNIVYNMTIQFSFYHEFGHYIFNHKNTYIPKNSEMESDFFALYNIIEMLFGLNHPYKSLYDKYCNEDKLYFLALSINLLFYITKTIYILDSALFKGEKILVNYGSAHPENSIRCNFQYIKNIASKSLAKFCLNNHEELLIIFEKKFQQAHDEVKFIWEDLALPKDNLQTEQRINREIEELFKNFKWGKIECTMFRP